MCSNSDTDSHKNMGLTTNFTYYGNHTSWNKYIHVRRGTQNYETLFNLQLKIIKYTNMHV